MDSDNMDDALSVIAWKVGVTYEILGSKRRGSSTGQSESKSIQRLLHRQRQIGAVRKVDALKDISFVARRGESIGIIGHNGSGKSTLLRAVAGLLPPTTGNVWLSGQPSLLGVNAVLLPKLSGERNIYIGGQALGLTTEQIAERYDDIVALADIGDAIDRPMSTYSSGQGARLRFAISSSARPEILMIDEALATGDAAFRERSKAKMVEMLENAGTLFLVSHSNSTIVNMCQRALWLDHGRLIMDGPADQVVDSYARGKVPRKRSISRNPIPTNAPPKALPIPDEPKLPVVRAIIWGRDCLQMLMTDDQSDTASASVMSDLLAAVESGGVVNLTVSPSEAIDDDREFVQRAGVSDLILQAEAPDEPLSVAVPKVLRGLALLPSDVLLVDSDPGTLSAVAMSLPGIQLLNCADSGAIDFLQRLARRVEGTAPAVSDSYRASVRRRNSAGWARTEGDESPDGLQFAVLEDLEALHLADRLDHLVNTSTELNLTSSRFAAGQCRQMISDLRRYRVFGVVAWDKWGVHGVVGLITVRRDDDALRDLVFADRMRGMDLMSAVAEHLRTRFDLVQTEFPLEAPKRSLVARRLDEAHAFLSENGLAPAESPELQILAGLDSGQVAVATGIESLAVGGQAAQQPLRTTKESEFHPGARVLGYWAGRDYDDQVWGEGATGLQAYRRAVEHFLEQCAGTRVAVALPAEGLGANSGPIGPERMTAYNAVWREAIREREDCDTLDVEVHEKDLRRLAGDGAAALALRLVQLTTGNSRLPAAPALPSPQHLELRGWFEDVGRLSSSPIELPIVWEGVRARVWEVEVTHSCEHLGRTGALVMIDASAVETVRSGRDGIVHFNGKGAPFYRYLDAVAPRSTTRFVIEAIEPITATKLALRTWGAQDLGVVVDSIRVWTHRSSESTREV